MLQHQLAAFLNPPDSAKGKMYLQMFYTCMINMVTTLAPVLRKLLANHVFSFPQQP